MNNSLILQVISRMMLPIALVYSVYLLWRGHNEPGGGFVGGLIAACGFIMYALPRGQTPLAKILLVPPQGIAGLGVLMGLSSGLAALVDGQPFLTHQWKFFPSEIAVGTALLFDIGVYFAVLGTVLTFLSYYLER